MATATTVVIGGGSAGCVVASTLAEDSDQEVILLEGGPVYGESDGTPEDVRSAWILPSVEGRFDHFWPVSSSRQGMPVLRGRVLGGGSAVNATNAVRPGAPDLQKWVEAGNPAWSWEQVLPHLMAIESTDAPGDWHGRTGPLVIRRPSPTELRPLAAAFMDAFERRGYPRLDDHNGPSPLGVGPAPMNQRSDGTRISAATAYLSPEQRGPNLVVRGDSVVSRVVIEGNRAVGVELDNGNVIHADRVVCSAGAYGSPAILLRSGIGPAWHLREFDIPVKVDLCGVGASLRDQPAGALIYQTSPDQADHGGAPAQLLAMVPSDGSFDPALVDLHVAPMLLPGTLVVGVALVDSAATGTVRLTGPDPADPLDIDLDMFTEPNVVRLTGGLRLARDIVADPAVSAHIEKELLPGPEVESDADWDAYLRSAAGSYHHGNGTCSMGPDPDAGAVVDEWGRVHGIGGLRVIDASIFPAQPLAPTNLLTMAVGHRIAGRMRRDCAALG